MKTKFLPLILLLTALMPMAAMAQKTHIANTASSTAMTWAEFADIVNNGTTYQGMTVYLDEDITATKMVGTDQNNCFKGTFDGQGHSITFNYSNTSEDWCAPFHYLNGTTICNLIINGTITANYDRCGGLAGNCYGTNAIINCLNNITINSTVNGDGTHGGFISRIYRGSTTFEGCTFAGKLLGGNTTANGGFVGWSEGNNNYASVSFSNCIYAPIANTMNQSAGATFARGRNESTTGITINNCFYTSSQFQYTQGSQSYTITGQSPITVGLYGTATNYNASYITAYEGTPGLLYNGTVIAGSGEQVSLNLGGGSHYGADHGTLSGTANPYTLTMEANNTTIIELDAAPYSTDFETNDWTLVNGSCTNKWCWGTAAYNGTGTHSLYISNNNGTNNAYNKNYDVMVYAYKTFYFEAGVYNFSYDWRGYGECGWDYLRVALVPNTESLEAGDEPPTGFSNTNLPEGWIALDEGHGLCGSSEWQTLNLYNVGIENAGAYRLVFAWCNDHSYGDNPPAAVDNLSFERIICPAPTQLAASNITATTADISWTGGPEVGNYTLIYRTRSYFNAIFSEGFENGLGDWTLRDCATNTGTSTAAASTGNAGFSFYNSTTPQYLISPELTGVDETMDLYFRVRNNSTGNIQEVPFYFGYSTTDDATESFTFEEIFSANGSMISLLMSIPAGTKYVCWKYASNNCQLYIDDISIGYDVPDGEWQTVIVEGGPVHVSTTLTGLIPEMSYQVRASSDCNTVTTSFYLYFTTTEACLTPSNLAVSNVSTTTADLNWMGEALVDSYTVQYRTLSTVIHEGFENGFGGWNPYNCSYSSWTGSQAAHIGFSGFYFGPNIWYSEQYLISPELTGVGLGMELKFYYRNEDSNYPMTFQVGFSATNNWIDSFTFGDEIIASDGQWHFYREIVPVGTKYICFKSIPDDSHYLYIDDIIVGRDGSDGEWQSITVAGNATDLSASLGDLMPATTYEVFVYPDCNPDKVSETVRFVTEVETVANLPYSTDFVYCDWTLVNGNCTNAWTWGTAANHGVVGNHGLYISNDGGNTNAYTNFLNTMVYAYKTIHFEAGLHYFGYNYRVQGEDNYDFLRVALVPASVSLAASEEPPTGFSTTTLPEGWIALDGGSQLNLSPNWQTMGYYAEVPTAGDYNLVFAWRNDYDYGDNPPAAIDHVIVEATDCYPPHNLAVGTVTTTTADFSWSAWPEVESYTVQYRIYQHYRPIFTEGFENSLSDWTLRNCTGNTGLTTENPHTGDDAFLFDNSTTPQYLISPELTGIDEEMTLRFFGRHCGHNWVENFYVGFSSTDFENESFTFNELEIGINGNWNQFIVTVPVGTKYICFKQANENDCQIAIDDISIELTVPEGEWQYVSVPGGTYEEHVTLTGLIPETFYQAFAYADCNLNITSVFKYFTTLEDCPVPIDLTVGNISATTANLSWTGEPEVDSYTVKYKPAFYTVLNEGFENGIDNWTLRDCGSSTGVENNFPAGAHSGNAFFHFWATSDTPQYFISPELTGIEHGMTLDFYYSANGPDIQYFQVGFSSSFNTTESFTFGETITIYDYNQWHQLSLAIPADTKYICWKFTPNVHYGFNLDDIMVSLGVSTSEWQTATVAGNANEVNATLTGLTPETEYEAYVYPDCNPYKKSKMVWFTTEAGSVFSIAIEGYDTTDGNWHLIALPVTRINPDNVEGMTTGDYDLYLFNPLHNDNEWENYKAEGVSFNLEAGKGYLYARSTDATLTFVEMPYSGNGEFALNYDANDEHKCWNLVGNPFDGEAHLDRPYYVLNADGTGINPVAIPATTPIPPYTAVFVKAVAEGDKAVFTRVTQ